MTRLAIATLAAFVSTIASNAASATRCANASDAVKAAQAAVASAARRADEAGAAYHGCMHRSQGDARARVVRRRALASAMAMKRQAREAYDAAVVRQRQSNG
jgi:hypothetical protein